MIILIIYVYITLRVDINITHHNNIIIRYASEKKFLIHFTHNITLQCIESVISIDIDR